MAILIVRVTDFSGAITFEFEVEAQPNKNKYAWSLNGYDCEAWFKQED